MKIKITMKYFLLFIPIIILIYFVWINVPQNNESGDYDSFAQCLTQSGAVMYGTERCHFCQEQKSLFGKSFSYINYKNCDNVRQECINADVEAYPTWNINNNNYRGLQSLEKLSSLSGCNL